jgi:hypothetical protein
MKRKQTHLKFPMNEVVYAGLVILTSSPYYAEVLVPGGGWSASRV